MGPNHSFLGFVKHTLEGLIRRMSLQFKHMLSSSSLCKNKEVLTRNGGGNWERNVSKPVFYGRVAFEHDTLSLTLCLGWKISLSLDHTPL
jgi:hypothetical protein